MNAKPIVVHGIPVPAILAERPNWIVWRLIKSRKRSVKMPFNPKTLTLADTSSPHTWGTLQQAATAIHTLQFAGMGFVFREGDGLFGVDLDSCFLNLFTLQPWASEILRSFHSYAEISPSGKGIKVYAGGSYADKPIVVPQGEVREGEKRPAVELHGRRQFFAFTGNHWEESPSDVLDCRFALGRFIRAHEVSTPVASNKPAANQAPIPPGRLSLMERGRIYISRVPVPACGTGTCQSRCFRVAYCLSREIGLDARETFTLLREWADRSEHGWDDAELHRTIANAIKMK